MQVTQVQGNVTGDITGRDKYVSTEASHNIAASPASPNPPEKLWDVFVCYAKEDLDRARMLYRDLREARMTPWMAYEDILPRQEWKRENTQALTRSRYMLALLSSNSVSRTGYMFRRS